MGDAPPVLALGEVLKAQHLAGAEHVPQPEIDAQPPVGLHRHLAGDQALGGDGAPALEIGHGVDVGDVLDKAGRIERAKQARAFQVGAHHLGDIGAGLGVAGGAGHEVGNGDGQRLRIALGDVDAQGRMGRGREQRGGGENKDQGKNDDKFLHANLQRLSMASIMAPTRQRAYCSSIWRGSKRKGLISDQT